MDLGTDILLTVVRESVSLFILLVFLFFAYRIAGQAMGIFEKNFGQIAKSLDKIADSMSEHD